MKKKGKAKANDDILKLISQTNTDLLKLIDMQKDKSVSLKKDISNDIDPKPLRRLEVEQMEYMISQYNKLKAEKENVLDLLQSCIDSWQKINKKSQ